MYLAGEAQMPSGMFKYAALLTCLLFLKDLCLPIACAEEPKIPATSTAIVIVDPTCDRFDAFTSDYLPAAQSEVVWVDGPEFGYFDYDHDSQLMLYIPATLNRDSIDTFDVYAINEQGDLKIASFFFDPATREMTFTTNISRKPAIQGEKAGLDDSGKPSKPSIPGIGDVPFLSQPYVFEFRVEDFRRRSSPPSRWIPQRPVVYDEPWSQLRGFQIEDLPGFSPPTVTPRYRYDLWLDDITRPRANWPE